MDRNKLGQVKLKQKKRGWINCQTEVRHDINNIRVGWLEIKHA
jgi:hypothetical protein